jgi:hypothetical protein
VPPTKTAKAMLVALIPIAVAVGAIATFSIPPDAQLGAMVRFVMFHGASTWVNMVTFTLAGLAGLGYLFGARGLLAWGQALRWFSLPLWMVNTVLGILSMQFIWGGILWKEPRLLMTFGVLAGSVIIVAIQLIADSPKIPAALDTVLAGSLWYLVLALPNLFHPDSPVFSSENTAYIAGFLGMVASVSIVAFAIVTLVARGGVNDLR